jgi:glutamate synthase (NADPH/NADH) small chain
MARGGRADMGAAWELLLTTNPLPEVTGRLCPEIFEETLCQNRKGERISLRALERFLAEYHGGACPIARVVEGAQGASAKVAVIGSGPAGLCAAWSLVRSGRQVTVFDSAPFPGGSLSYGYGEFQFPVQALRAVFQRFQAAGVGFVNNFIFGRTALPADLFDEGYGALILATGTGVAASLGIPGESAGGVFTSGELLKAVNGRREDPGLWLGPRVVVVGENDTAMACARLAVRLKRETVVVIRGPETQIKALAMFARHAAEEGVKFKSFTRPVSVMAGPNGCVKALVCRYLDYRMDVQGRMVLMDDASSEFQIEADTLIIAAGGEADTLFLRDIPGLEFNADASLRTRPDFAETSLKGVFAAGGVVEPEMSLTDAMLAGIRAAQETGKYLNV